MSESITASQRLLASIVHVMPTALGVPTGGILQHASEDALLDIARSLGILSICHDCGTVVGVKSGTPEADRRASARAYEEMGMLDCCGDNTIL